MSGSNAVRIAQFLASSRSLSINFDIYLNKILIELQESAIGLRTKAMKALAAIISADPNLLHRVGARVVELAVALYLYYIILGGIMENASLDFRKCPKFGPNNSPKLSKIFIVANK